MTTPTTRLERAHIALEGLSVGDAFGERFFLHPNIVEGLLAQRAEARSSGRFTVSTGMGGA